MVAANENYDFVLNRQVSVLVMMCFVNSKKQTDFARFINMTIDVVKHLIHRNGNLFNVELGLGCWKPVLPMYRKSPELPELLPVKSNPNCASTIPGDYLYSAVMDTAFVNPVLQPSIEKV